MLTLHASSLRKDALDKLKYESFKRFRLLLIFHVFVCLMNSLCKQPSQVGYQAFLFLLFLTWVESYLNFWKFLLKQPALVLVDSPIQVCQRPIEQPHSALDPPLIPHPQTDSRETSREFVQNGDEMRADLPPRLPPVTGGGRERHPAPPERREGTRARRGGARQGERLHPGRSSTSGHPQSPSYLAPLILYFPIR